jgi:hypothetical protein
MYPDGLSGKLEKSAVLLLLLLLLSSAAKPKYCSVALVRSMAC